MASPQLKNANNIHREHQREDLTTWQLERRDRDSHHYYEAHALLYYLPPRLSSHCYRHRLKSNLFCQQNRAPVCSRPIHLTKLPHQPSMRRGSKIRLSNEQLVHFSGHRHVGIVRQQGNFQWRYQFVGYERSYQHSTHVLQNDII